MKPVADGVWQLNGSPATTANAYFAGGTLFDCRTRWAAGSITKELRGRGLRLIALTHAHPDHWGAAAILSARFGARVAVHRADAGIVKGHDLAGTHLAFRLGKRLWEGQACGDVAMLEDGDMVGDFRVVHAPGHSAGHVVYFRESDRIAITGDLFSTMDAWTRRWRLAEPPAHLCADPEENRRSIHMLLDLKPATVLPGHGPALRDLDRLASFVSQLGRGGASDGGERPVREPVKHRHAGQIVVDEDSRIERR